MIRKGRPFSKPVRRRRVGKKRNPVYSSEVERHFDSTGTIRYKQSRRGLRAGGTKVNLHSKIYYDEGGGVVDTDRRLFTSHTKRKRRNPLAP